MEEEEELRLLANHLTLTKQLPHTKPLPHPSLTICMPLTLCPFPPPASHSAPLPVPSPCTCPEAQMRTQAGSWLNGYPPLHGLRRWGEK